MSVELKFKNYLIKKPIYLSNKEPDKWEFSVCKMHDNGSTYYVIAKFWWNYDEPCWEFRSVGTRYLEDYTPGLNEWLLKVMELFELEIRDTDLNNTY